MISVGKKVLWGVLIFVVLCSIIGCYYVANASELSLKVSESNVEDMPTPQGVLPIMPETTNLGKLIKSNEKSVYELSGNEKNAEVFVNYDLLNIGLVYLKVTEADASKIRVVILPHGMENDAKMTRVYKQGYYPLTFGSGDYLLVLFHKMNESNQYRPVFYASLSAEFDEVDPYKYSNVYSSYNENSLLVKKAYELTHDIASNEEKVEKLVKFLRKNIRYDVDYEKNVDIIGEQIFDSDVYYQKGKGVCYQYASLFSSMAKSIGIPAREVRGYREKNEGIFHSWNEYYLEGKGWITIDTMYQNVEYYKDDFSER